MVAVSQNTEGLHGQIAGKTALCSVGASGVGLRYRGYEIQDLAEHCQFEEVAYLLLNDDLPNQEQLDAFKQSIQEKRALPDSIKEVLERIPVTTHPMDVLRTGVSFLGNIEGEYAQGKQQVEVERLLAVLPGICCYWYHYSHNGKRVKTQSDADSIGGHFLHMLNGSVDPLFEQVMHVSLILYAEHEFNASTFNARVCASTLSDFHSCITSAIGTLRGPLHGGANEAAMNMIDQWHSPDEAEAGILEMLENKEKIMGFGHAVYRTSDPRNEIIKKWARKLSQKQGDSRLYPISERCEEVMWREKELFCNADFFHACAYHFMSIPTKLFTPIFVMSRLTGWAAHIFEQRAHNRIIRPSAEYIGPETRSVKPIDER